MSVRRPPNVQTDELLEALMSKLDHISTIQQQRQDQHNATDQLQQQIKSASKPDSYTIGQILTAFVAVIGLLGSVGGLWMNLTNQITEQKVKYDLTIDQVHKDIDIQKVAIKENQQQIIDTKTEFTKSMKDLSAHLDDLDNTVQSIYNKVK